MNEECTGCPYNLDGVCHFQDEYGCVNDYKPSETAVRIIQSEEMRRKA